MSIQMNRKWLTAGILSLLVINTVTIKTASSGPLDRFEPPPWGELFLQLLVAKTVLSSLNTVLLTILLVTYIGIYRKTRSDFSVGLVIFTVALLLYSFTSNPLIHGLVGFRVSGLGPFTMLPDLFTCIASAILLYLSRQ